MTTGKTVKGALVRFKPIGKREDVTSEERQQDGLPHTSDHTAVSDLQVARMVMMTMMVVMMAMMVVMVVMTMMVAVAMALMLVEMWMIM